MVKASKPKRKYTRRPKPLSIPPSHGGPFVVYVTYPSNTKEYAYLCDFPVRQGDYVLGNGNSRCCVVRTAASNPLAWKYVRPMPDAEALRRKERAFEITKRLNELDKARIELDRFRALARINPEAKKLLAELKELSK